MIVKKKNILLLLELKKAHVYFHLKIIKTQDYTPNVKQLNEPIWNGVLQN